MVAYYSEEEIQRQLERLRRARGVTDAERELVMARLESRVADEGEFRWVQCPVWRQRLYESSKAYGVDLSILNRIMRYVLEGEQPMRVSSSIRS